MCAFQTLGHPNGILPSFFNSIIDEKHQQRVGATDCIITLSSWSEDNSRHVNFLDLCPSLWA